MKHATCVRLQLFFEKTKRSSNYFSFHEELENTFCAWVHKIFKNFHRGAYRLLFSMFHFDVVFIFFFINGWISLETIYTPASKQYVIEHEKSCVAFSLTCLLALPFHDDLNSSLIIHGVFQFLPARINKLIKWPVPIELLCTSSGVTTSPLNSFNRILNMNGKRWQVKLKTKEKGSDWSVVDVSIDARWTAFSR